MQWRLSLEKILIENTDIRTHLFAVHLAVWCTHRHIVFVHRRARYATHQCRIRASRGLHCVSEGSKWGPTRRTIVVHVISALTTNWKHTQYGSRQLDSYQLERTNVRSRRETNLFVVRDGLKLHATHSTIISKYSSIASPRGYSEDQPLDNRAVSHTCIC